MAISRRSFCLAGGALVVSFPMLMRPGTSHAALLPGSLSRAPYLDAWIRIDAAGKITVFTGKVELGQGIKTAILQIAAEELQVPPLSIQLITADTNLTANEGYTAGSHSLQDSGTAVRNAAAQVRELLIETAAQRWQIDVARVAADQGRIVAADGRSTHYGELVADNLLHVQAREEEKLVTPNQFC